VIAGSLEIELSANLARLSSDMSQAKSLVGSAANDITRSLSQIKEIAAVVGVGFSVEKVREFTMGALQAVAAMKDLGEMAGTTAEGISRFEAPTKRAGGSLEQVATAMYRLSIAAKDAKDPTSAAAMALNAIGISTAQLKALRPDQMFELIARQLGNYNDGLDKNAIMQQLFGRSGREMNSIMKAVADQSQLTASVTNKQADEAKHLEEQMAEVKLTSDKFWRSLVSDAVPAISNVMKSFIELRGVMGTVGAGMQAFFESAHPLTLQQQLLDVNNRISISLKAQQDLEKNGSTQFGIEKSAEISRAGQLNGLIQERKNIEKSIFDQEMDEQNKRALAVLSGKGKDPNFDPAGMKAAIAERERLRKLDNDGWVKYIDALEAEWDKGNQDNARISEDFFKREDQLQQQGNKDWVKYIDALQEEWDKEQKEMGELSPSFSEALQKQARATLDQLESGFHGVWDAITSGGGDTAKRVRDAFKRTFFDWIYEQAAKPIFLQFIGALSMGGVSGAANAAGGAGSGLNLLGNLGSLLPGGAMGSFFSSGATSIATTLGVENAGLLASIGEMASFIPIIGSIIGLASLAYSLFGHPGGGPKTGGSFYTGGAVPGTDNGRFFTPNQSDADMQTLVKATSTGFMNAFLALGGSGTPGFNFGLGTDSDPHGTAGSRISALLTDSSGHSLIDVRDLSTDDVTGSLSLESQRMILKALQSSDLPKDVKDLLNSVVADTASADDVQKVIAGALQLKAAIDGLAKLNWGNLDLASLKKLQLAGETIDQTFARIAGEMSAFDNAFLTDAQKLDLAKQHVHAVFAQLGISVPASTADLVALVHGLDLTTEAGRTFFNLIMSVFPDLQVIFNTTTTSTDNLGGSATNTANNIDTLSSSIDNMGQSVYSARKALGDFLGSLLQDTTLSPLSLDQRLALAKTDYLNDLKTGLGTPDQIAAAQSDAKLYLQLAQQKYGGADYTAIFQQVYQQLGKYAVGAPTFNQAFNAKDAAATAVGKMNSDLSRLLSTVVTITDQRMSAVKDSVDNLTRVVQSQSLNALGVQD
jgi:hypothetical protein